MPEVDNRLLVGLEAALSSHIRNMIITVGAGLTIFSIQRTNKSFDENIIPLLFIITGVSMGCVAIYTYRRNIESVRNNSFTYDSPIANYYLILCVVQILVVLGFGHFTFTKILK